ncbi:hypothetical protein ASG67_02910 [Sphingomonas sp. Leaf339]|uniref:hypothetical protein n=1 Tax=Sphingomonas sp. Leaf339 TaxID=1736343 RepID=UPI0006FA75F5|nr:hypothetical protein [Sphingomonas sp. Leaf339]KQU62097.1 hypothetical protein ASG67_02910 [Sphingomonas sp. Leaf339]
MAQVFTLTTDAPAKDNRVLRGCLFGAWLGIAGYFIITHVMWRDEVRALSFALAGDSIGAMLRGVQGEGHPVLWYVLLRVAHDLAPVREVLPAMGAAIGIAAAAMLAFRAPFRPIILMLAPFGEWLIFEYTAVARNYGMSALILFVIADRYDPRSGRGWLAGVLLFLLCNTNVPSMLLACGILLFWLVELLTSDGLRLTPAIKRWAVAAGCSAFGAIACALAVYPPYNDAAVSPALHHLSPAIIWNAATDWVNALFRLLPFYLWQWRPATDVLLVVLVCCMPLSLIRSPGGFAASLFATAIFILFFGLIYPASYRHAALLLAFVIALHWMVARGGGGRWSSTIQPKLQLPASVGSAGLALLLALQVSITMVQLDYMLHGGVYSRSADLGQLLKRPDLRRAVVMANPDVMIEALGYYAPNPTWLVRQHQFGRVVRFTFYPDKDLSLGELLAEAQFVRRQTRRPVVIVIREHLDAGRAAKIGDEGYQITFSTTPAQVHDFFAATRRIARFGPAQMDEDYDVYLLR